MEGEALGEAPACVPAPLGNATPGTFRVATLALLILPLCCRGGSVLSGDLDPLSKQKALELVRVFFHELLVHNRYSEIDLKGGRGEALLHDSRRR